MEITRHFTTTTTIVCKDKVLLHFHKSLKEAALREAKEEAGLDIELHQSGENYEAAGAKNLILPAHIMLQDINEHHQHIDFVFYATAKTFDLKPMKGETENLKWFTAEEINKLDAPKNVKVRALEALKILA